MVLSLRGLASPFLVPAHAQTADYFNEMTADPGYPGESGQTVTGRLTTAAVDSRLQRHWLLPTMLQRDRVRNGSLTRLTGDVQAPAAVTAAGVLLSHPIMATAGGQSGIASGLQSGKENRDRLFLGTRDHRIIPLSGGKAACLYCVHRQSRYDEKENVQSGRWQKPDMEHMADLL